MVSVDACHKMKLGSNPSRSKEISSKMSHRQNGWEMEKVRKQEFGGVNSGGKRIDQNEELESRSREVKKSENQKIRKSESQKVKINENQSDESREKEEKWKKKREESKNRRMRRK